MYTNDLEQRIGRYLSMLARGDVAPAEASEWALMKMEALAEQQVSPRLWRGLDQLSGADLLEGPEMPLHSRADYEAWLLEFTGES